MKMFRFATIAVLFVMLAAASVSAQSQQPIAAFMPLPPQSLTIGSAFPGPCELWGIAGAGDANPSDLYWQTDKVSTNYDGSGGEAGLQSAVKQLADLLVYRFEPVVVGQLWPHADYMVTPGMASLTNYIVGIMVSGTPPDGGMGVGAQMIPTNGACGPHPYNTLCGFNLVPDTNGNLVIPPSIRTMAPLDYGDYIQFHTPGLKGVLIQYYKSWWPGHAFQEVSANGVSDPTSGLYPGGWEYQGPDELELPSDYIVPSQAASDQITGGSVTLYWSDDHSVFTAYDLLTGQMVGSSVIFLTIAPVVAPTAKAKVAPPISELLIGITGPAGRTVTIESSTDLTNWTVLGTARNPTGHTSTVVYSPGPQRFYRARMVRLQ